MDSSSLDLNLLKVFDAMLRHQHVTRAGEALGLSQPAMSAALARLRAQFDDPLFVRSGAQMRPTPRAQALEPTVQGLMQTITTELLAPTQFDPATSGRLFKLLTPDIAEVNFLPRVLAHLAAHAPGVRLQTLAMPRQVAAESLESGAADLALGYFPDLERAGFVRQRLLRTGHVCVMRKNHPTLGERITQAQFLKAAHAVVKPDGREHVFEQFLARQGVQRQVVVELSHFMSLLPIVETSDLIATVPKDLAQFFARHGNVRFVETPMKSPVIDVHLFWHERFQRDKAHAWLRGLIFNLFRPA